MGQVTIYLDTKTEESLKRVAENSGMSKSKWVAALIQEKVGTEWSAAIGLMAGAWKDFPEAEEIRSIPGADMPRDTL